MVQFQVQLWSMHKRLECEVLQKVRYINTLTLYSSDNRSSPRFAYDTIRYDRPTVYLTCSKSWRSTTRNEQKCKKRNETKNKLMSMISPVQSNYHESMSKERLRWEGFVEKVGFQPLVKQWRSDGCWEQRWWQGWVDTWLLPRRIYSFIHSSSSSSSVLCPLTKMTSIHYNVKSSR